MLTLSAQGQRRRVDALAGEEPLELRVGGRPLTVTMRTPGHDVELAHGFLLTEAAIAAHSDVHTARFCTRSPGTPRDLETDRGNSPSDSSDLSPDRGLPGYNRGAS